jgi:hypothetical protein
MSDKGLGVYEIAAGELTKSGGKVWTTKQGCIGIVSSPCPRNWSEDGKTSWLKLLKPSELPQGINKLYVVARDPVNNSSTAYEFSLKVDHTAPSVALSGSMTTSKFEKPEPQYVLVAKSSDGTEAAPQAGIASTEITLDGKVVDSTSAGCATQNCAVTREWVLNSTNYSPGAHTVVVKVTDGAGLVTQKTIKVNLVADTAAPELTSLTGGLENAPSGWVEQKSYSLNASAADAGYGVTSIEFLMDGKVASKKTQSCPAGACAGNLSTSLNMAAYKGGAHTAEYVVKDGAGNVVKKAWTVNVDPSGAVSAAEAVDTLEAIEETTEASPIAPSEEVIDPSEVEAGNNPGLEASEGELTSTGTGATTVMTTDPKEGLTIESGEGDISITPIGGAEGTASEVASDVAAVSGGSSVDTVTRPIYDGSQTFKAIRDETAPETYSWKVSLNEGQMLKAIDSEHVSIFNQDGTQALAITAQPAHDATGKEVPTSVSASEGNVLTLTVKYKGKGFIYPIIGGPAFQASYTLPVIWEPAPPPAEAGAEEVLIVSGSAPQYAGCPASGEACASSSEPYKTYAAERCVKVPAVGCTSWGWKIKGFFYYTGFLAHFSKRQPKCDGWAWPTLEVSEDYCEWVGPNWQSCCQGYHISSQTRFILKRTAPPTATDTRYITMWLFGSGYWKATTSDKICNPTQNC